MIQSRLTVGNDDFQRINRRSEKSDVVFAARACGRRETFSCRNSIESRSRKNQLPKFVVGDENFEGRSEQKRHLSLLEFGKMKAAVHCTVKAAALSCAARTAAYAENDFNRKGKK
jgi:hypothetical protein